MVSGNKSEHHATEKTGVKAKQGDRRTMTLWILVLATVLAAVVGWILLSTTDEFTADREPLLEDAPNPQSPPVVPGTEPS